MLCNEIEYSAENKGGKDGNQHGRDDDITQAVVVIVADPKCISEHSAGKRGGMAGNRGNNLEDYIFPHILKESASHFMLGEKLP